MLIKAKKELKSNIIIIPQFIVFKHNVHQMMDFDKYCKKIGVKADFKAPYLRGNSNLSESNISKYKRNRYRNESEWLNAMSDCDSAFTNMTILRDGTVVPCCCACNDEFEFGNILETEVATIWDSEEYRNFRWDLIHNNAPNYCKENCLAYFLKQKD
jgi:radical SAM protein with 4Fe4S-binding SPASM domain